ncbi:hypothetical protein [Microbispora sp. NBC_01189]|uniref:hypothetical protein n=1 Tax=Microbispora sp. NBC_01189 TaxID=2903583 RepID=UPI002E1280EB
MPLEQCRSVTQESYDLLATSARVSAHLVPLAERWALDRLRRLGILDNRLTHSVPEVLFVDRHDSV